MDGLMPPTGIVGASPSYEQWMSAADVLRREFKGRGKAERAILQNDVLIALLAKELRAELWAEDEDFSAICGVLGVRWVRYGG
jgi:predicted nucleic acid-binding protein